MAGDHYIQAALMGRWGEPRTKAPRERNVAVRMKLPAKTFMTTPDNVGKENCLYPPWVEKSVKAVSTQSAVRIKSITSSVLPCPTPNGI